MEENRASGHLEGHGAIITQDSPEDHVISPNGDINTLFANNFPNPPSTTGEINEERQYSQQSAIIAKQKKRHVKVNTEKAKTSKSNRMNKNHKHLLLQKKTGGLEYIDDKYLLVMITFTYKI